MKKVALALFVVCDILFVDAQSFWQKSNGPLPGSITVLAADSSGTVYAGTNDGVYRSTNNGATWTQTGLTNYNKISSLAVTKSGDVFAGSTYNGSNSARRIFRSTDHGDSWTQSSLNFDVSSIIVDTSGRLFAGMSNGVSGVYISTDDGISWNATTAPGNAVATLSSNDSGHVFDVTGSLIYRSTDHGATWTQIYPGPKGFVALCANSTGTLFAATGTAPQGFQQSTDNGATWTVIGGIENIVSLTRSANGTIFAGNSNQLGTDTNTVYRSTDNGTTWSPIPLVTTKSPNAIQSLTVAPNGNVFAGHGSRGIFRSTDGGSTWTATSSGISLTSVSRLNINSSGHLFLYERYGHTFRSTDGGTSWTTIAYPLTGGGGSLGIKDNGVLFDALASPDIEHSTNEGNSWITGTANHPYGNVGEFAFDTVGGIYFSSRVGIFKSTDGGSTFQQWALTTSDLGTIAIDRRGVIFTGLRLTGGTYRSTDGGGNWTNVNNINGSFAFNSSCQIFEAGGYGVYRSLDTGTTWTKVFEAVQGPIAINAADIICIGTGSGVYRSTDNGATWGKDSSGMTNLDIRALALGPDGYLYAGNYEGGLFRSTSNVLPVELTSFTAALQGEDVELFWNTATETNNYGFQIERCSDVKSQHGRENWTTIGFVKGGGTSNSPREYSFRDRSASGGVKSYRLKQLDRGGKFEYSKTVQVEISVPHLLKLSESFPNPFNPSTTIEFTVPKNGKVSLKIYDVLGREVAALFNGTAEVGRVYESTFEASRFSSGVYFSRLEFSGVQLVKRMMLQK